MARSRGSLSCDDRIESTWGFQLHVNVLVLLYILKGNCKGNCFNEYRDKRWQASVVFGNIFIYNQTASSLVWEIFDMVNKFMVMEEAVENVAVLQYDDACSSDDATLHNFARDFMDIDEFFALTVAIPSSETEDMDQHDDKAGKTKLCSPTPAESCTNSKYKPELNDRPDSSQVEKINNKTKDFDNTDRRNKEASKKQNINTSRQQISTPSRTTFRNGKDKTYWERRQRNNVAAKRSRDAKRLKEAKVVKQWKYLEDENAKLKAEILVVKKQTKELEKIRGLTDFSD